MTAILNQPIGQFKILEFNFSVNFYESVNKKIKIGEVLTNKRALEIFKEIKFKSNVLSFLTHSFFVFSAGLAVLTAGTLIPPTGIAFTVVSIAVCALGGGIIGFSIDNSFNGFLPSLSQAYRTQSKMAAQCIKDLESATANVILQ